MNPDNSLQNFMTILEHNSRVCPQPMVWNELWSLLRDKKQNQNGSWSPPLPLILSAWWETSDLEKSLRFHLHLNWAEKNNQVDEVLDYLTKLNEYQWHHFND